IRWVLNASYKIPEIYYSPQRREERKERHGLYTENLSALCAFAVTDSIFNLFKIVFQTSSG
ncbi:MAG: hypothetical protein Q7R45_03335, partial [Sulfuricaulis sp.]|nr:hypothetical protein [Sulfuricaulis sp.]